MVAMRRKGMGAALAALATLALPAPAGAADYWVGPGGSNGSDGLSVATRWATLQHAADRVDPGDTVHVLDGSYTGFYLDRSGAPGQPITFVATGDGASVVADNPVTPDGINLEGASHVVIDGFTVNGRTRAGIRAVLGDFVTIRNCSLGHNGKWGILTGFVDDFVAEGNVAHHSVVEHGIYVSNSADRPVVRGNLVYSNHANGLHFNGDASLGGDGLIEDALVEDNVIFDNGEGGGSGINMDGGVGGVIRNNLLYDNHASGISLYRIDGGAGSTGNLVVNNTIVNASDGRWCVNIRDGSTNNTVRNNLLYNHHSFRGAITVDAASRPGLVADHNGVIGRFSVDGGNSVISLSAWQALGYGAESFLVTPAALFVAPGSDFHLLETAPAVDAGAATGAPSTDLDGNPRPVGAAVDVGAYELATSLCGNGAPDPNEECGEPGLSCGAGQSCASCACVNEPACTSGMAIEKARLKLRAEPGAFVATGEAVIPKPWSGVDPPANGIRLVVDEADGTGGFDVTLPGGAAWLPSSSGTRWRYVDPTGSAGGVLRAIVIDGSNREPGLLRFKVRARSEAWELPDVSSVRTHVVLGDAAECASLEWNGPSGAKPRCEEKPGKLVCR